jgi:hypothetical protein
LLLLLTSVGEASASLLLRVQSYNRFLAPPNISQKKIDFCAFLSILTKIFAEIGTQIGLKIATSAVKKNSAECKFLCRRLIFLGLESVLFE